MTAPDATPTAREGCDCTELCSMGPTCPGGMLARLPGSGCHRTAPSEGVTDLIERSSLGTPEARARRESVSDEQAARIVARSKELEAGAECDGCICLTEHDGDYGSSGHAGACPPHICGRESAEAEWWLSNVEAVAEVARGYKARAEAAEAKVARGEALARVLETERPSSSAWRGAYRNNAQRLRAALAAEVASPDRQTWEWRVPGSDVAVRRMHLEVDDHHRVQIHEALVGQLLAEAGWERTS